MVMKNNPAYSYEHMNSRALFSSPGKTNRKSSMAPENTPHTTEHPSEHPDQDVHPSNNVVEPSSADLPPYAYTVNGGVPPFGQAYVPGYPYPQNAAMNNLPHQGTAAGNIPAESAYAGGAPIEGDSMGRIAPGGVPAGYPPYYGAYPYQPQAGFPPVGAAYQPTQEGMYTMPSFSEAPAAPAPAPTLIDGFDYDNITSPARIALYDNLKTAPRVIQIQGAPTHEYIERIASLTYKHAKEAGGVIPYTVIREVSENFIHARFQEIVVSIMDDGNTIRFADQGPGISNKDLIQEPGFSSATEPMKRYIRGVGSGLPIVREYLDTTHGYIEIEDNINKGSVVTISLVAARSIHDDLPEDIPDLTENEEKILKTLLPDLVLGITDMNRLTEVPVASIHSAFSKMEEHGLVEKVNKKRTLTAFGKRIATKLA